MDKRLLYNAGISLYETAVLLASPFHAKAKLMVEGRKDWQTKLQKAVSGWSGTIWVHCSSLGEFEQGRPLIEAIRQKHPERKILLTFFSPSGYEVRKNYNQADHVCYLPLDTPANARTFIDLVQPALAVFVKYDIWLNLIEGCLHHDVPVVLVSAHLRPDSKFLTSMLAAEYKKAFGTMRCIYTQDQFTAELLRSFCGTSTILATGDTRFDRAAELPGKFEEVEGVREFIGGRRCIVAGSPWPKDEAVLLPVIEKMRSRGICWIIAPHEINKDLITKHCKSSGGKMVAYSNLSGASKSADVLWIDNVGMLSRLYHYAEMAYIGGGFGIGIHNTQEAAVYGCPVIFGPNYEKFHEAVDLVRNGGAVSVKNSDQLEWAIIRWLDDETLLAKTRENNQEYMREMSGATSRIMVSLEKQGLI